MFLIYLQKYSLKPKISFQALIIDKTEKLLYGLKHISTRSSNCYQHYMVLKINE